MTKTTDAEKAEVLREMAGLFKSDPDLTVREAYDQWRTSDPERFRRLDACIETLMLIEAEAKA
jgi:hypothetical protein